MVSLGECYQYSQSQQKLDSCDNQKSASSTKRIPPFEPVITTNSKRLNEFSVLASSEDQSCAQSVSASQVAVTMPHRGLNIKCVTFEELLKDFKAIFETSNIERETAEKYIRSANNSIVKRRNGGWLYINLPYKVAMQVALPRHTHNQKEQPLISHPALNPMDAAQNYTLWSESDKKNSPKCYSSVEYHLKNPNQKPIFLTVSPINIRNVYGDILDNPELVRNRLIHLDGLHRLVALALSDNPPQFVPAYIACEESPKHIDALCQISKRGLE